MAYNTFLTNAGIGLLNASTEANPVVFVKGVFGDGVLVKNLNITSLVNEIYSTTDLITGPVMDDTYYCRFVLPAGTFLTDKTIKEVGLYAKLQGQADNQAILFSACIYPATLISPITDGASKSLLINYQFKTSNADANIFISDSVSNVTEDELYQVLTAYAEKTYVDDEITALRTDLLNQNLLDTSVIDFVLGEDIGEINTEGMAVKICCDDAGNPVIKKLIDYISEPGVFLTDLGSMYPVTALAVSTTYIHSIKIKRLNNIDFCVIAYSPVVNSDSGSAAKGLYLAVFEIKSLNENDAIKLVHRIGTNIHTITYDSTKPDEIINAMMRYSNIHLDIFSEDDTSLRFVLFFDDTIHPAPVLNTDTYPNIIPEDTYTSNWNCSVGYLQLMEGNDEFSDITTTALSTSSGLPRSCRYAYDESYNTYLCAIETHGYTGTYATQYRLKSITAIQPIKFDTNKLPYIFGLTPTFVNPVEDLAEPDNDVFGIISDFLYTKNHTFAFTYVRTVSDDRMDLDVRSYDRWNNFRIDTKYDALINKKMSNRIAYCTVSDTGVVTIEYTNEIMLGKRVFNADLKKVDNDMVLLSFYGTTDDDYTKYSTTDGNNTIYPVNMYFQLYEVLSTGRLSSISSSLKSIETFNKNLLSYANNDKLYNKKLYKLTEAGHIRQPLLENVFDIINTSNPYRLTLHSNSGITRTASSTDELLVSATLPESFYNFDDRLRHVNDNWIKFDGSELQRVLYFQYDGSTRFIIKKDNTSGTIVGYTTDATGGNITTNNGSGTVIGYVTIEGGITNFTAIQGYGIKYNVHVQPFMGNDGNTAYFTPILENIYRNISTTFVYSFPIPKNYRELFLPERNLIYHYLYNVQNAGLLPFRMNSVKLNKKKSITNGWMYDIEINFDYDFLEYENEYTDECRKVLNTVNYTYNYKITKVLNGSTVYTSELNQVGLIDYKKEISILNNKFIKTPDNALYNKVADENLDKFAGRIVDCKKYHFIKNELFELNGINVNLITQPLGEFSMVKRPSSANALLPFLWSSDSSAILKLSQYIPYPLSVVSMMSYQFFNHKDVDCYIGTLLESGVKSESKPVRIAGKVSVLYKEQFAFTSVLAPASDIYASKNVRYNKLSTIVSNNRIGLILREVEPGDETKGYYCLMFNDINKFNMTEFYNKLLNN